MNEDLIVPVCVCSIHKLRHSQWIGCSVAYNIKGENSAISAILHNKGL